MGGPPPTPKPGAGLWCKIGHRRAADYLTVLVDNIAWLAFYKLLQKIFNAHFAHKAYTLAVFFVSRGQASSLANLRTSGWLAHQLALRFYAMRPL